MTERRPEPRLMDEAERIRLAAIRSGVTLRLCGGLAVWTRCHRYRFLHSQHQREFGDIDYVGRFREKGKVEQLFVEKLGYREDRGTKTIPGIKRSVFLDFDNRRHIDVFYDELNMCHSLDLRKRLEVNARTIPPADLLLQKLQIVEINQKDLLDCALLLLQFPLDDSDEDAINLDYLASLCARDWGLWRTLTLNISRLKEFAASLGGLDPDERATLQSRANCMSDELGRVSKSLVWRIRSVVGDRIQWYQDVEERC